MRLLLWQLPRRRRPEPMFRAPGSRGQSSAVGSERYLPEGDINEERVSLGAIPIVVSLGKAVHGSSAFPDPATGAVGALAAPRHDRHAKRAATVPIGRITAGLAFCAQPSPACGAASGCSPQTGTAPSLARCCCATRCVAAAAAIMLRGGGRKAPLNQCCGGVAAPWGGPVKRGLVRSGRLQPPF
jgi:hypothetical protein